MAPRKHAKTEERETNNRLKQRTEVIFQGKEESTNLHL